MVLTFYIIITIRNNSQQAQMNLYFKDKPDHITHSTLCDVTVKTYFQIESYFACGWMKLMTGCVFISFILFLKRLFDV